MRTLYSLVFLALLPFVTLRLFIKGRSLPGYRERVSERFGRYDSIAISGELIWIHAVSVGECEAAFPLIRRIRSEWPELNVLMTCTTATGSSRIQAVLGDGVIHVYLPYDIPWFVSRFLDHFKPMLGIVMETEIWPNLFTEASRRNIPIVIANGRLSDRSVRGYARIKALLQPALESVRAVAAQSSEDALRYRQLGLAESRVQTVGNIKFDISWTEDQARDSQELRMRLFGSRLVLVAGSTHPGEEELVLIAFKQLRETFRDLVLVLVPRHPERAKACQALCHETGFTSQALSALDNFSSQDDILVIDRVGELRRFYGTSDLAYIGGSLVPHGGQNPLEPLIAGVPVLFGPHMMNFKEIRTLILNAEAGYEIHSPQELAQQATHLLSNAENAHAMGEGGSRMISANQGALTRLMGCIAPFLPSTP